MKELLRETSSKPGPGGYDGTTFTHKKSSPKCSFGKAAQRPTSIRKDSNPGPGAYKIPTQLMDTPTYATVKHDPKHKYV